MKFFNLLSLSAMLVFQQSVVFSQNDASIQKELTLKDAVLGPMRIYGPERMFGFQWLQPWFMPIALPIPLTQVVVL